MQLFLSNNFSSFMKKNTDLSGVKKCGVRVEAMVKAWVQGWGLLYVNECPHKDGNTSICVYSLVLVYIFIMNKLEF